MLKSSNISPFFVNPIGNRLSMRGPTYDHHPYNLRILYVCPHTCLNPKGNLIGKIKVPEIVSNVCFGGPKLNRLFITATTSMYSVFLNVNGSH